MNRNNAKQTAVSNLPMPLTNCWYATSVKSDSGSSRKKNLRRLVRTLTSTSLIKAAALAPSVDHSWSAM